jgi:arginase family enzyme
MDISIYFQPSLVDTETYLPTQLGSQISRFTTSDNFPSLENKSIALIGVLEDRGSVNNSGTKNAPDLVRKYLYKLFSLTQNSAIVDLGNIHQGFTKEDTYFALSSAITSLVKKNIIPIIIGGGQDLTYANFIAYEKLEQMVNVVSVDPVFDIGNIDDRNVNSSNYLGNIILHQPNFLFNYSNIGYQTYFVEQPALDLISKLYFDAYRLGFFKFNIEVRFGFTNKHNSYLEVNLMQINFYHWIRSEWLLNQRNVDKLNEK